MIFDYIPCGTNVIGNWLPPTTDILDPNFLPCNHIFPILYKDSKNIFS